CSSDLVPMSTLPVYIVTTPSLPTARKLSTWSGATGLPAAALCAPTVGARLNDTTSAPVPTRNSRRVVSRVAMSGPLAHEGGRALDGGDDPLVRPAAAEVVAERLADLAVGGAGLPGAEKGRRLHDHPVDAVAALRGLLVDERLLDRMR